MLATLSLLKLAKIQVFKHCCLLKNNLLHTKEQQNNSSLQVVQQV